MCRGQYSITHQKHVGRKDQHDRHDAHLSFTSICFILIMFFCLWFVLLPFRYQFKLYRNRFNHKDGKISEFIRQQSKYIQCIDKGKGKEKMKKKEKICQISPAVHGIHGQVYHRIESFEGKKEHNVVLNSIK